MSRVQRAKGHAPKVHAQRVAVTLIVALLAHVARIILMMSRSCVVGLSSYCEIQALLTIRPDRVHLSLHLTSPIPTTVLETPHSPFQNFVPISDITTPHALPLPLFSPPRHSPSLLSTPLLHPLVFAQLFLVSTNHLTSRALQFNFFSTQWLPKMK